MTPRLLDAGDGAVTIEFGDQITSQLVGRVAALDKLLQAARERGELAGVVETMPTFRSLTVLYDPLQTSRAALDPVLTALASQSEAAPTANGRRWRLPVCYGGEFGADLADVASATGLSPDAVVQLHADTELSVYMIGFMPGFPYMGGLPPQLAMPRLANPRKAVPARSLAVTGEMCAVYPWESPGGWNLLGRTPVPLFDVTEEAAPALLESGDQMRLRVVDRAEYEHIAGELAAGRLSRANFRIAAEAA